MVEDVSEDVTKSRLDPLADPKERRILYAALDSYRQYRHAAHYNITHLRRQSFYSLPSSHMDLLSEPPFSLPDVFDRVDDAIDSNADIAEAILAAGLAMHGIHPDDDHWKGKATPSDLDKARSSIRQLYRDWSVEGAREREVCFLPIFSALESHIPSEETRHERRILVPGAGLGRLQFELCRLGYVVEGNEISHHQLLASNYILNCTESAGQHTLFPWALNFNNHLTRSHQLEHVVVPDVHPGTTLAAGEEMLRSPLHYSERMSMNAGDFSSIYKLPERRECFDAVTTCFFIDTAPNVINYIEAIRLCLKPQGLWINIGPLLWHFAPSPTPAQQIRGTAVSSEATQQQDEANGVGETGSFELSNREVLALVKRLGFTIIEEKQAPAGVAGYVQDPRSMLQNVYTPSFWVARKTE